MTSRESESGSPEPQRPHRTTNDDLYRRSTQYRYWSFPKSRLEDLRVAANKKGIDATNKRVAQLDPADEGTSLISEHGEYPYVTAEEELQIVTYYARKCKDLANFFRLPSQARATAIMYLYKFFLVNSVMIYHPQYIMYTCLFLAAKVENSFIGIANFSKAIPKTTPDSILQYEYTIVQSMRFSLRCHHPYLSLYGFYLDIQELMPEVDFKRLGLSCDKARELVTEGLFTDAPFLFTPPQVALACLWLADQDLAESYLRCKFKLDKSLAVHQLDTVKEEEGEEEVKVKQEGGTPDDKENDLEPDSEPKLEPDSEPAFELLSGPKKYAKMVEVIHKCTHLLEHGTVNPSVADAKRISAKVHYCLEPAKYGRKLAKAIHNVADAVKGAAAKAPQIDPALAAEGTPEVSPPAGSVAVKREAEEIDTPTKKQRTV